MEFKVAPTRRSHYKSEPLKTGLSPKLILRAVRAIAEGEELTVGYKPVIRTPEPVANEDDVDDLEVETVGQ
jgi:SET domain-containing protein